MAQGEFILKFKIEGDGKGAKLVSAEVAKAAKGQDYLARATKNANDAQGQQAKTMRDGVRGTANSTKNFSKLAETVGGGLVGAYAALAANIFAVSAAFNALRGAQQAQLVLEGLETQGARTGRTLTVAAQNLREVVRLGISSQEAMQATAQFTAAGFSATQLERLGAVAENTSLALGRNLTDSMDRLIKGTVKLEPELLDELGIMTKLGDATRVYALQLNKSEASLTQFEKRQAFLNAVLAEGEAKFDGISDNVDANPYDQLAASFSNLTKEFLGFVNETLGVGSAVKFLAENTTALTGLILIFGSTIKNQLLGSMADLSRLSIEAARGERALALENIKGAKAAVEAERARKRLALTEKSNISLHAASAKALKVQQDAMRQASLSVEQLDAAYKTNERSIRSHQSLLDRGNATLRDGSSRQQLINDLHRQSKAILDLKTATENYTQASSQELAVRRQRTAANVAELRARALESRAAAAQNVSLFNLRGTYNSLAQSTRQYAIALQLQIRNMERAAAEGGRLATVQLLLVRSTAGLKTAAFAAQSGIITLGSALLKGAGYAGMVLFAWDLLKSAYEAAYAYLFPETAKAQEELNSVMEEFEEIVANASKAAAEYNRIMNSQASISTRVINANSILANSLIEVIDKYKEATAAIDELEAAKERDAQRNSNSFMTRLLTGIAVSELNRAGNFEMGTEIANNLAEQQRAFSETVEAKLFDNIANSGPRVEAARELIAGLEAQLGPRRLQKALEDAGVDVNNFSEDDLPALGRAADAVSRDANKLRQGLETLRQAFIDGEEQSTKFIQGLIPRSGYDDIIQNYENLNNAILDLKESMDSGLTDTNQIAQALTGIGPNASTFLDQGAQERLRLISEAATLYQAQKDNLDELSAVERARVLEAKELLDNSGEQLDILQSSFQEAENMLRNMRAQVALAQAQASLEQARLSKFSQYLQAGSAGLKARIESEERIRNLQAAGLAADKAIVDAKIAQKEAAIERMREERQGIKDQLENLEIQESVTNQLVQQLLLIREMVKATTGFDVAEQFGRAVLERVQAEENLTQAEREAYQQDQANRRREELTRALAQADRSITSAERELDSMRLASQVLGTQIAAATFENLNQAQKNAKFALEDAQQAVERVRRTNEEEEARSANELSALRLRAVSAEAGEELQIRLDIIKAEAKLARENLERERTARIALFEAQINDARAILATATGSQRDGIVETIALLTEQKLNYGFITNQQLDMMSNEERMNTLQAIGLNTLKDRLDVLREYIEEQLKLNELSLKYDQASSNLRRATRNTIATILNVEIPGETIRVLKEEQEFRKRQNEIERTRIDLEYQLLAAQYTLEREKMRVIAANMEASDAARRAATDAIAAYDQLLGTGGVGSGNETPTGGGTLEQGRINARGLLDTEYQANELAISEALVAQWTDNLLAQFAKLGPEGEAMSALFSGLTAVTFSIQNVFETLSSGTATTAQKITAVAEAMTAALSTISSVVAATSQAKIANIDREIAAEEKRDGKSAESVARIEAMEKKKDAIARKAFNTNKKIMMAQAVISTAAGVANALATPAPFPIPAIMAGIIGAMGAAQLAIIGSTSYQSATSRTAEVSTPSSLQIGRRDNNVDLARGPNPNAGGEVGYIRGSQGYGSNASNYNTIGSAYGGSLGRGYGRTGFVVGEKGPEVLTPEVPVSVTPNDQINQPQNISANFSIQAIDASGVQELLLSQRGNIIGMIRDAANANGQAFLEDVNTNVYTSPSVGKLI